MPEPFDLDPTTGHLLFRPGGEPTPLRGANGHPSAADDPTRPSPATPTQRAVRSTNKTRDRFLPPFLSPGAVPGGNAALAAPGALCYARCTSAKSGCRSLFFTQVLHWRAMRKQNQKVNASGDHTYNSWKRRKEDDYEHTGRSLSEVRLAAFRLVVYSARRSCRHRGRSLPGHKQPQPSSSIRHCCRPHRAPAHPRYLRLHRPNRPGLLSPCYSFRESRRPNHRA